jgi:hypothetical protein
MAEPYKFSPPEAVDYLGFRDSGIKGFRNSGLPNPPIPEFLNS